MHSYLWAHAWWLTRHQAWTSLGRNSRQKRLRWDRVLSSQWLTGELTYGPPQVCWNFMLLRRMWPYSTTTAHTGRCRKARSFRSSICRNSALLLLTWPWSGGWQLHPQMIGRCKIEPHKSGQTTSTRSHPSHPLLQWWCWPYHLSEYNPYETAYSIKDDETCGYRVRHMFPTPTWNKVTLFLLPAHSNCCCQQQGVSIKTDMQLPDQPCTECWCRDCLPCWLQHQLVNPATTSILMLQQWSSHT